MVGRAAGQEGLGGDREGGRAGGAPHPQPRGDPALAPRHPHLSHGSAPGLHSPRTRCHLPGPLHLCWQHLGGPRATCSPQGAGAVWGGDTGGPGAAADPSGIKDLAPTSHPQAGLGWEMLPAFPAGVSPGFGAPLGLTVQLHARPSQFHPTAGSVRILGGGPAVAEICRFTSWICPQLHCLSSKQLPSAVPASPAAGWESPLEQEAGAAVPFPLFIATAAAEMTKTRESWSGAA